MLMGIPPVEIKINYVYEIKKGKTLWSLAQLLFRIAN
jgi:hypothetical protein